MTLTKPGVPIILEDIFGWVREGNALQVRYWLDDTEHDLNQGDDHGFSLLHWAAKEGHSTIVEMLLLRGARVNSTNMGDDTCLHLACAHGHRDVVVKLLQAASKKPNANLDLLNAVNEHGNTPLHYACFWNYEMIIEDLLRAGASISIANKYDELPAEKCSPDLAKRIYEFAAQMGQDIKQRVSYRSVVAAAGGGGGFGTMGSSAGGGGGGTLGSGGTMRTRTRDATLSRYSGVDLNQLKLTSKIASGRSGELWKGNWQGNEIVAQILNLREVTPRIVRDFVEEFPRLRIFSHPNVSPVLACSAQAPNLALVSQYMPFGSLYDVLHERTDVVVDHARALKFAIDIARGMTFLHSLDPLILRYYLNSKHVVVDEELSAKINMADTKFSFQERGRLYDPAWMSPDALQKRPDQMNVRAGDIWSFAVLLWELNTREVPFADLSPMEIGMKVAMEGLQITIPPGLGRNMNRLITLCMNEEPGKRPSFDQVLPILEKMIAS